MTCLIAPYTMQFEEMDTPLALEAFCIETRRRVFVGMWSYTGAKK